MRNAIRNGNSNEDYIVIPREVKFSDFACTFKWINFETSLFNAMQSILPGSIKVLPRAMNE